MKAYPKLYSASEEQLELLHQYSIKIIQTIGMRIEDPEVRAMLCEHGCTEKGDRVYFAPELVAEMIESLKQSKRPISWAAYNLYNHRHISYDRFISFIKSQELRF